jgi:hypothetical protein
MKSNEFRYTINADGITTLQDVIDIFKGFRFSATISDLYEKDSMDVLDILHSKGLVTKEGKVNGKYVRVYTDSELKDKFTSIKEKGVGVL